MKIASQNSLLFLLRADNTRDSKKGSEKVLGRVLGIIQGIPPQFFLAALTAICSSEISLRKTEFLKGPDFIHPSQP